ncbi:YdeI/OmpD-associated family protein [Segetibacter koreensis]|uniref:YdeI/OmpD-associated family protein n=1 Tax=Segetibacter koreensis TaxID=398037 RepID=UPI0003670263|nr:YdeI/OmpD-associated family protein [Segetibacter koreensis]
MADTKKISFDTAILQIGNNTGICVPNEVVEELGAGKKPPVEVTLNDDYTYRNTVAVMSGKFMIGVSADIRSKTGIKGGDKVKVTLELDTKPREVEVPAYFQQLLNENPTAKQFFEALSYSNQQRYVLPIEQAKTEETRQRRMEKAILDLSEGKK